MVVCGGGRTGSELHRAGVSLHRAVRCHLPAIPGTGRATVPTPIEADWHDRSVERIRLTPQDECADRCTVVGVVHAATGTAAVSVMEHDVVVADFRGIDVFDLSCGHGFGSGGGDRRTHLWQHVGAS